MARRARSHLTFANVMACIAVFVALGGTGYAAMKLPKNSVGAKQIKAGGVRSSDVRDGTLRARDFKPGELPAGVPGTPGAPGPAGAKGDKGEAGADGADGTAVAFARVNADGTLGANTALTKGVAQPNIQHNPGPFAAEATGDGVYCFGGLPFTPASAVATVDNADAVAASNQIVSAIVFRGEDLGRCDADHGQARVSIIQVNDTAAPALVNKAFYIWFED